MVAAESSRLFEIPRPTNRQPACFTIGTPPMRSRTLFASSSRSRSRPRPVAPTPSGSAKRGFAGSLRRRSIGSGRAFPPKHPQRGPEHDINADARDALIVVTVGELAAVVARPACEMLAAPQHRRPIVLDDELRWHRRAEQGEQAC